MAVAEMQIVGFAVIEGNCQNQNLPKIRYHHCAYF